MLKAAAGRGLELALNQALALDPETRHALAGLEQRRITIVLEAPALAMEVLVKDQKLHVGPVQENEADIAMRGTIGGFLSQLPFFRRPDAGAIGKLRIEGDAELARKLQHLMQRFEPDMQLPFTRLFGDVLGVQIASALQKAFQQGQQFAETMAYSTKDYLVEERRDIIGRAELAAFHDDVDALREDADRLEAKLKRLTQRVFAQAGSEGETR